MKFIASAVSIAAMASVAVAQIPAAPVLEQICPNTSCPEGDQECRTAAQAAPWIAQSMLDYEIYNTKAMASVIALMAYESGDFKYKKNLNPDNHGQGTANMQSPSFNLQYAQSIPALKDKYAGKTNLSPEELDSMLVDLMDDKYNFASGAWFLKTQCPSQLAGFESGDAQAAFLAHMGCVGVDMNDKRQAYFDLALKAFKV